MDSQVVLTVAAGDLGTPRVRHPHRATAHQWCLTPPRPWPSGLRAPVLASVGRFSTLCSRLGGLLNDRHRLLTRSTHRDTIPIRRNHDLRILWRGDYEEKSRNQHGLHGKFSLLENVEAEVCQEFGERYIHAKTFDAIDHLLERQHEVKANFQVEVVSL